jgi:hypothetical protein
MYRWIAEVSSSRIPAVLSSDATKIIGYFIERLVPINPLPTLCGSFYRVPQSIFVVVDVLERNCLRANVSATERIVLISTNIKTLVTRNGDLDAAQGFAEIAVAIMRTTFHSAQITHAGPVSRSKNSVIPPSLGSASFY